jgi:hypothetical protein
MDILLIIIGGYYIGGYWKLFYSWLFFVIISYITIIIDYSKLFYLRSLYHLKIILNY